MTPTIPLTPALPMLVPLILVAPIQIAPLISTLSLTPTMPLLFDLVIEPSAQFSSILSIDFSLLASVSGLVPLTTTSGDASSPFTNPTPFVSVHQDHSPMKQPSLADVHSLGSATDAAYIASFVKVPQDVGLSTHYIYHRSLNGDPHYQNCLSPTDISRYPADISWYNYSWYFHSRSPSLYERYHYPHHHSPQRRFISPLLTLFIMP